MPRPDASPALPDWPYPRWIAHRGAGTLAPENTLAAFRRGAALGWRMFECDVKLSADGQPFLLHDATLERTTSGHGLAGRLPWAELSVLDAGAWHSPVHKGEPLPTLEALVRLALAEGWQLNLEIKPTPGTEELTGSVVASRCAGLWAAHAPPGAALPLLTSFAPQALAAARGSAPELPRALLLETWWDGWLEAALSLQCVAVVAAHGLLYAGSVAQLHARGLRTLAYTVNDPADAERLLAQNIDGLITDAVDVFRPDGPAPGPHGS